MRGSEMEFQPPDNDDPRDDEDKAVDSLIALMERCGAEVCRYEGRPYWVKLWTPAIYSLSAALDQLDAALVEQRDGAMVLLHEEREKALIPHPETPAPLRGELSDETIKSLVTKAVQSDKLSWLGFEEDAEGRYTIPSLSRVHYGLVRIGYDAALAAPVPQSAGWQPIAWKTTHKAVCVPITESAEVAKQWRSHGWPVIELYAAAPGIAPHQPQPEPQEAAEGKHLLRLALTNIARCPNNGAPATVRAMRQTAVDALNADDALSAPREASKAVPVADEAAIDGEVRNLFVTQGPRGLMMKCRQLTLAASQPEPTSKGEDGTLLEDLDELASDLYYEGNCEMSQEKQSRAALIDRGMEALRAALSTASQQRALSDEQAELDHATEAIHKGTVDGLQEIIRRLKKDAARLDWLDASNAHFKMGWQVSMARAGNVSVKTIIQLGTVRLTPIREAIDSAILAAAVKGDE